MYNYFFYMVVKFRQAQKLDHDAAFDGAGAVYVLVSLHVVTLFVLVKGVLGAEYLNHPSVNALPYMIRKLVYLPFAIFFFYLVYRYYKRNYRKIVEMYSSKYPQFSHWRGFVYYIIILVISGTACLGLIEVFG